MTRQQKKEVEIILEVALAGLLKDAQEAQETEKPTSGASGHMHYLVKALAKTLLTKEQQQQVEAMIDLHRRCMYPLAFVASEPRQLCSLCPEGEQNEIGHDFFGEPCQINGEPCCEVCATVDKLFA